MNTQTDLVLFVYGTLKRGCRSHGRLSGSQCIGVAWTKPVYRMYNCGTYPGLVLTSDGESVEGELYRVNSEVIAVLDEFEHNYRRMPIELVESIAGVWGYIYLGDVSVLSPCGPVWSES
jgi:gamma-glutamylaminecyclotransferase